MALAAGFPAVKEAGIIVTVKTAAKEVEIEGVNTSKADRPENMRAAFEALIAKDEALLRELAGAAKDKDKAQQRAETEKELALLRAELAGLKTWKLGKDGAQLTRTLHRHKLRWETGGLVYLITIVSLDKQASDQDLVAAYTALASRLQALPAADGPAPAGVCFGAGFLAVDETILALDTTSEWETGRQVVDGGFRETTLVLASHYSAPARPPGRAGAASDRTDSTRSRPSDDGWLLSPDCNRSTWPQLDVGTLAGLEAVTQRSDSTSDGPQDMPCRALRTVSRSQPSVAAPWTLTADASFMSPSRHELDEFEQIWRKGLASTVMFNLEPSARAAGR